MLAAGQRSTLPTMPSFDTARVDVPDLSRHALISPTVASCLCAIDTLRYRFMIYVRVAPPKLYPSVLSTLTPAFGGFPHLFPVC
jgi:hypothetical protein